MTDIVLARYHAQLMHCGYKKMYLTLKQRVYWTDLYADTRKYVSQCETCHVSKANRHPVKAEIQIHDVPPEIFHTVHMDHVKIAVKNATHKYTHALVLIDANSMLLINSSEEHICSRDLPGNSTRMDRPLWRIFRISDRQTCLIHRKIDEKADRRLWNTACANKCLPLSIKWTSRENERARIARQASDCKNMDNWLQLLPAIAASYKAAVIPSRGLSHFNCYMV